jgi:transposase
MPSSCSDDLRERVLAGWRAGAEQSRCDRGRSSSASRRWLAASSVTLRREHRAGEKCFVVFSGNGVRGVDAATGEVRVARLFVAALGASNLTYVEPVFSEDVPT